MENMKKDVEIGVVAREDVNGPYSLLTLNEKGTMGHDFAGDGTLLFVAQVFPKPCLRVFHQETKQELGTFPAPARGHFIPFKFRLRNYESVGDGGSRGTLYMLDGIHTKIAGLQPHFILEYEYEYSPAAGLKANLVKESSIEANTVPFTEVVEGAEPNGGMFITSFDIIDEDRIVLADCYAGVIWLYDMKTEALSIAFTHERFTVKPWPKEQQVTLPDGSTVAGFSGWTHENREKKVPYYYQFPMLPGLTTRVMVGLHGITLYENGATRKVVFADAAILGIHAIDVSELLRTDVPYNQKTFERVAPRIKGVTNFVPEVQADTYNPGSPWVYFQRPMSGANEIVDKGYEKWIEKYNPLYRVNMETGKVEFVADDWKLWDFTTNLNVIPGKPGFIRLTSTPIQQHRLPQATDLLTDMNDFSRLPDDSVFTAIDVKS